MEAVLAELTTDQLRFVVARQHCTSDKEAAEEIGLAPHSVYSWPNKDRVNDAVRLMALDGLIMAAHVRQRNLAKAMLVKVAGLDLPDDRLRQAVATEIIEWEMGKPTQRQEVTGADGGPLAIQLEWGDDAPDEEGA